MYELVYSRESINNLKKLNKEIRKRIISGLERIRIRPHNNIKKLVGVPYFALRVGDYRIILDIKNNELKIFVIEVGHRKNIYKKC